MRWWCFPVVLMLAFPALAEDVFLHEPVPDFLDIDPRSRIEFHERVEGEDKPPLERPEYELMTQPCMGWHFQAGTALYNADAGRELLLLTSAVEAGGAALLITALEDNASISHQIPGTAGAWAMAPMRGDRVAIGTYYDGAIHIYDLPQNAFIETVDIPGEAYVWNLVEGADGRLYGGTFPGGKLIALDQDTLEIEDCGPVAPPNRFLHQVSPLPDGRLLCRAGTEAPVMRLYDPETKSFSDAPEALAGVAGGVLWSEYFVTESAVFDGALQLVSPPPFPIPDGEEEDWSILTTVTDRHALYLRRDNAVHRYAAGETGLTLLYDLDLRGGRLMAASVNGGVIGVRGQQYFHLQPGATTVNRQQFPIASPPRATTFLKMDPRGQVWGAPPSGQTLFFMDGETGVFVSMGSVSPRMGRVQDVAFVGHVAYGISSPNGDIFRLDIEEPWNEWEGSNPAILDSLRDKGYPNASGGIIAAGDSRLVSGWAAASGAHGGALAVTTADSGRTRLMENPLGRQGITGLAADTQYLFAGTTIKAEGALARENASPQFVVLGLDTLQPYWNYGFDGAETVDRLLYLDTDGVVAMAVDGRLRLFDVAAMRLRPPYPGLPPEITSNALADRNDGHVYYAHQTQIIRLNLDSGAWATVIDMPTEVGPLTGSPDGGLYAGCGVNVYRILFPEPYPDIVETPTEHP